MPTVVTTERLIFRVCDDAGVLSLDTKLAREVMVPRTDTLMLDVDDDISENLETILNCSYSRLPLYEEDKDKVIG